MPAGRPGINTAAAVREMLWRGPAKANELIKLMPDHNPHTIRNSLHNMMRFGAVTLTVRTWRMKPRIKTEADYLALLQEFRAEKKRQETERAIAAKAPDRPYVPLLRTDPLAVALRSAW